MQKTEQVFVTNTRRREGIADLSGLTKRTEQIRGSDATIIPGSPCGGHCLPECETYRITDIDAIIDSLSERWGFVIGEELVSEAGVSAAITVQASLERLDNHTFQLPSRAQWVVDVWFDDLHADTGFHYAWVPDRLIVTTIDLPTDIVVDAVYFNKVTT